MLLGVTKKREHRHRRITRLGVQRAVVDCPPIDPWWGAGFQATDRQLAFAQLRTRFLSFGMVLGVGFLIIPARRRRAKATLQGKLTSLRERLTAALTTEFARAQELSAQRLQDLVAPYGRFVRAEDGRWREVAQSLTSLQQRTAALLSQIEKRT